MDRGAGGFSGIGDFDSYEEESESDDENTKRLQNLKIDFDSDDAVGVLFVQGSIKKKSIDVNIKGKKEKITGIVFKHGKFNQENKNNFSHRPKRYILALSQNKKNKSLIYGRRAGKKGFYELKPDEESFILKALLNPSGDAVGSKFKEVSAQTSVAVRRLSDRINKRLKEL
tara:strand:+ start:860 stop:1372 length:513 start_codon:yes stop_codon:yes gene_type:complete